MTISLWLHSRPDIYPKNNSVRQAEPADRIKQLSKFQCYANFSFGWRAAVVSSGRPIGVL